MKINQLKNSYNICIIRCAERSTGTGFLVKEQNRLFIITDYHVLYKRNHSLYHIDCTLTFTIQNDSFNSMTMFRVDIENSNVFADEDLDVAAFELTNKNSCVEIGLKTLEDLTPFSLGQFSIQDIWGQKTYIYGHPTSLNREAPFDMKPFITDGIVSAYDDTDGKFITNIPAFYGNSGSPVLYVNDENNVMVIGIVQQLIHFRLDWRNGYETEAVRSDWQNSGYSICLEVNKIKSFLQANVTH